MSIIEENWDIKLNLTTIEENNYVEFEARVKCLHEHILNLIDNGFKVHKYNYNGNVAQNDDELITLMERNKQLRHDIDSKLEDLSQQKIQYENYKKGILIRLLFISLHFWFSFLLIHILFMYSLDKEEHRYLTRNIVIFFVIKY